MTSDQQNFINSIAQGAEQTYSTTGVLPSVTMAQAILESGWGQYAPNYNLFGIKGSGSAGSQTLLTHEEVNGRTVTVSDNFRAYNNYTESIQDHAKLLAGSNYTGVRQATTPEGQTQALQNAGYATDSNYASSLMTVIKQNNLTQYDSGLGSVSLLSGTTSTTSTPSTSILGGVQTSIYTGITYFGLVAVLIFAMYVTFVKE